MHSHPSLRPLDEQEPLDYEGYCNTTFGSDSDPGGLEFDFGLQKPTHKHRDSGDAANFQVKKKRRPQITDQVLELRARSVLTDQALALKEDRRRTNSLESAGTMPFGARKKRNPNGAHSIGL